jgi:putative intracellular protease/amidase
MNKNILVILSASDHLNLEDGKVYPTGFYLNELMVPVKKLIDAGFSPVFATPGGNLPSMDPGSDSPAYFGNDEKAYAEHKALLSELNLLSGTLSPVSSFREILFLGLDRFGGMFVPGGHAPMEDLADNPELGEILEHFHEREKPTALVCHGPVVLLSAVRDAKRFMEIVRNKDFDAAAEFSGAWPYEGYDMTVFSTEEEEAVAGENGIGGTVLYDPQTTLALAGGRIKTAGRPFEGNVVVFKELITGQNPASDEPLADRFIEMLESRNDGGETGAGDRCTTDPFIEMLESRG